MLLQVRAAQLSDLVYKQGQAGISKATVTITFDNADTSNRPIGFDKYDEIIVRRQVCFRKCSMNIKIPNVNKLLILNRKKDYHCLLILDNFTIKFQDILYGEFKTF